MDKSWVKIYRQLQQSAIWVESSAFDRRSAWIDLIMMANIQNKQIIYQGQVLTIKRGQVYTSRRKLADRWHWSREKVNRFIKLLENLHMITLDKRTTNATLITIVKYEFFQDKPTKDKATNKTTDKAKDNATDESLLKNIKEDKKNKEGSFPTSSEVDAAEDDEEPPVPGAVRLPNGGWDYRPEVKFDDELEEDET